MLPKPTKKMLFISLNRDRGAGLSLYRKVRCEKSQGPSTATSERRALDHGESKGMKSPEHRSRIGHFSLHEMSTCRFKSVAGKGNNGKGDEESFVNQ